MIACTIGHGHLTLGLKGLPPFIDVRVCMMWLNEISFVVSGVAMRMLSPLYECRPLD